METRKMIPLKAEEFKIDSEGITIGLDFANEIKTDGNKFAELFGEGIDLLGLVEKNLLLPLGRCPNTFEVIYGTTDHGKQVVENHHLYRKPNFLQGVKRKVLNTINNILR
jgi:hypothetical protein